MATPRYAWGIDIGNRALKAVRLSGGADGLRIDDYDVIEHEQILSNAGDNREGLITAALANFVQRHEVDGAPVAIGVSGQSSFARFIKLPPVEPRKIPEIVRFEAIQQIPFPLDEVEWSYQLFQDPQSPDVEVGIFAMRKELVNQHIRYFTDAGLNVQAVQMNPLAVYNGMYHDERIKGTTMVIDVGSENTDLIIAEGETIWLRSIPIGGNNFTEALVKAFKLKFPKAEELKRNAATSKYGRQILQAMKPVFNDLVGEIQRSIGFYASVHRDSRISRVMALGGTFRLPGLQKYVQQNLQIDVHRIDRLGVGAPADARVATQLSENILSSVGAYGLAIQAMGQAKIGSSLLPMRIRREKMWKEKTKWFAAAAACVVAAPLVGYLAVSLGDRSLHATDGVDAENRRVMTQAKQYSDDWESQVENAGAADRTRIQNVLSIVQGRSTQAALLHDIAACLPQPDPVLLTNDKAKMPPRPQREIIRIDRIAMDYQPNMSQILQMTENEFAAVAVQGAAGGGQQNSSRARFPTGGMYDPRMRLHMPSNMAPYMPPAPSAGGTGSAGTPAGPTQRGYVVELLVTTPHADGASFVRNRFLNNLAKLSVASLSGTTPPPAGYSLASGYSVEKVIEPSYVKLGAGDTGNGQQTFRPNTFTPNTFNPRTPGGLGTGGVRPLTGGAATPSTGPAAPDFDPMKDPATGEDMKDDVQVTIRLAVVLDPPPPTPANGAAGSQVAQANQ